MNITCGVTSLAAPIFRNEYPEFTPFYGICFYSIIILMCNVLVEYCFFIHSMVFFSICFQNELFVLIVLIVYI